MNFYNPYLFQLGPNVTLHISAAFSQGTNQEVGFTMLDLSLVAETPGGGPSPKQKPFPCLPVEKQIPGFIWGADSCDVPTCGGPLMYEYKNDETAVHQITLHVGFKGKNCSDGTRFVIGWSDPVVAELITQEQPYSVTIGYKLYSGGESGYDATIQLVLDDVTAHLPKPNAAFQSHGLGFSKLSREQQQ